jgi:glycosyltransferase involved in cell wall biosynthesis
MNIGLLTTSFPRYCGDFAGHFVLGFARTLVDNGHCVHVLAPEPSDGRRAPRWPNLTVGWVPYLRPQVLSRTFYGAGVPDNLRNSALAWVGLTPFIVSLSHEVRKARPNWDVIVSHWALPCALIAGALRGQRHHIAVFHSADLHLLARLPGRSALARTISRGADKLAFVAPALRDLFLDFIPPAERAGVSERCRVFPMGIEPIPAPSADRNALRDRIGFNRFTLLFIGRLVEVKGVSDAIHAVSRRRDLELAVVGEGPELPALENLARRHQAPVRFFGKLTGIAKHDILRAADGFINPSRVLDSGRTEGTPTALIEAMAHRLPIIATDVGGVSSILKHMHSALLVAPGDRAALTASVDLLLRDSELRYRLGAQSEALSQHLLWPSLAGRLEALLVT